jgi:TetR/AcrR family transcriptional regulator, regulator of autoinduction and epiphytic fitness
MRPSSRLACGAGMDDRDPRIIRTRASVLRAATDLLVEGGPSAVTMDAIVARSGVAKSTIYRHWQSRDDVLVEVFAECAPNIEAPSPEVAFEPALRDLMSSLVTYLHDPEWARIVPALLMLKTHADGVADLEKRLEKNQSDAISEILRRGIAEGAIAPDLDLDVATAQLVGPLLFAQLTGSTPLDHALADNTIDNFLAAQARPRDPAA